MRNIRNGIHGAVACVAAFAPAAGLAQGEVTTPQATGVIRAEFLAGAPAPTQVARVCVVDSGVSDTPDTRGRVVAALTSMSDGLGGRDADPVGHGTAVIQAMVAPRNGWGSVGTWPAGEVVSVRAGGVDPATGRFGYDWLAWTKAGRLCLTQPGVKVISMSLGGENLGAGSTEAMNDLVTQAHIDGVSVVVAAGNDGLLGLSQVARTPGALVVAAVDSAGGARCGLSNWQPGVLAAPGCGNVAVGDPATGGVVVWNGTSIATPQVAGVLAALRSYNPALTRQQAEAILRDTAQPRDDVRIVDATAAFTAAGLGAMTTTSPPATSTAPTTPTTGAGASPTRQGQPVASAKRTVSLRPPRPRVRVVRTHPGVVSVRMSQACTRCWLESRSRWVIGRGGPRGLVVKVPPRRTRIAVFNLVGIASFPTYVTLTPAMGRTR